MNLAPVFYALGVIALLSLGMLAGAALAQSEVRRQQREANQHLAELADPDSPTT
jgi:hypothetical protein